MWQVLPPFFPVCAVRGIPLFYLFPWRQVTASSLVWSSCVFSMWREGQSPESIPHCMSLLSFSASVSLFSTLPCVGLFLKYISFIYSLCVHGYWHGTQFLWRLNLSCFHVDTQHRTQVHETWWQEPLPAEPPPGHLVLSSYLTSTLAIITCDFYNTISKFFF